MLNIPEEIKQKLLEGCNKNFRVHFPNGEHADITNENIVAESVSFTESICSQSELKFGLCESPYIEFETFGIGKIKGCEIECSLEIPYTASTSIVASMVKTVTTDNTEKWSYYGISDLLQGTEQLQVGDILEAECPMGKGLILELGFLRGTWIEGYTNKIFKVVTEQDISSSQIGIKYLFPDTKLHDITISLKRAASEESIYSIPLGKFVVDSCKKQADMTHRRIIAYNTTKVESMPLSEMLLRQRRLKVSTDRTFDIVKRALSYVPSYAEGLFDKTQVSAMTGTSGFNMTIGGCSIEVLIQRFNIANNDKLYSVHTELGSVYLNDVAKIASYDNVLERLLVFARQRKPDLNESQFIAEYNEKFKKRYCCLGIWLDSEYKYQSSIADSGLIFKDGNDASVYAYETPGTSGSIQTYIEIPYLVNISYGIYSDSVELKKTSKTKVYGLSHSLFGKFNGTESRIMDDEAEMYQNNTEWNANSALKYLESFFELVGSYGKTDRQGNLAQLELKSGLSALYPSETLYPSTNLYPDGVNGGMLQKSGYQSIWYDDDYTLPIGAVRADYKKSETEVAAMQKYASGYDADTPTQTYRTYDLSNNELIKSSLISKANMGTLLEGFLENASGISYMPAEIEMQGRPDLEAGDVLEIATTDETITTIILSRTMNGIQALFDSVKSD